MGISPLQTELKKFPDGEKYVRIHGEIEGKVVTIIQSMAYNPDEFLFEFLLLADAARDLGARKVLGVFPYISYARQDTRFRAGEAVSLITVGKLIRAVGVDSIYTIDSHRHRLQDFSDILKIPVTDLTAMPLLANYVRKRVKLRDTLVIGPDAESEQFAHTMAKELASSYEVLEKKRSGPREVRITARNIDAKGRDILIADDIVSTGGTVIEAARLLRRQGAKRIVVTCTHPLLVGNALKQIMAAGVERVIGTDTVQSPVSVVSVAPVIGDALSAEARH